jgi:hypothetical protein
MFNTFSTFHLSNFKQETSHASVSVDGINETSLRGEMAPGTVHTSLQPASSNVQR